MSEIYVTVTNTKSKLIILAIIRLCCRQVRNLPTGDPWFLTC